jgi:alpha-amylase/alpha-mannosidase (GH57 family)
MNRYICIHGHFYQPPRENAWLESIERQDSAYPYHDWNERITAECYAPNTASRILDKENYITTIVNNYMNISFNFGPTLLAWLETTYIDVYNAIIEADQYSIKKYSGHGSAIAQAYNHMIMPLANQKDKYTQILWGLIDFKHRFNRKPEGMWLPETAVDIETLDIMTKLGIRFTILAPHQAKRVRKIGDTNWTDTSNDDIDTTMPYEILLPSGNKMAIFFYNGSISRNVAFDALLTNGDKFAERLVSAYDAMIKRPQLVHIATDGETYGHHHRFGDMALAFALNKIEELGLAKITNYGEFLEIYPPSYEVEINELTSWSCLHGVERWKSNCGCSTGKNRRWNQEWRQPLRNALDWLRDDVAIKYEQKAQGLLINPWEVRDQYIGIILDRSSDNIEKFINQFQNHVLSGEEVIITLKLLELQRHAMLMYTSCGWFFDDLSGLETVQVIQYAGRVVQLAEELFGENYEELFLQRLEKAKSNIKEHVNGRQIYEKFVKPAMLDLTKVFAHFAVSSLFEEYGETAEIFSFQIKEKEVNVFDVGKARLSVGRGCVLSVVTHEKENLIFGVLHFGDHNINAGVHIYEGDEAYQTMLKELAEIFSAADFTESVRLLDKHFGTSTYSLRSLFRDEQRKIIDNILKSALSEIETAYRQVYEYHYPPMRFLSELGYPIPRSYKAAATLILNSGLQEAVSQDTLNIDQINSYLEEVATWQVELDSEGLNYLLQQNLETIMSNLASNPEDIELLNKIISSLQVTHYQTFSVELWKVQNSYYQILNTVYPKLKKRKEEGDTSVQRWIEDYMHLGSLLNIRVD